MQLTEEKNKLFLQLSQLISNGKSIANNVIESIIQGVDSNFECSNRIISEKLFHLAYDKKNLTVFNSLIDKGVDVNSKDAKGYTVLHKNFYAILTLSGSMCWNNKKHLSDLLNLETSFTHSILSALVKLENFSNLSDPDGLTYFHIACTSSHINAVEFFLKNGVLVNQTVISNCFKGYAPIHFAVEFTNVNATEVLLKHGAKINEKNSQGKTPLKMCVEKNISFFDPINVYHDRCDRNEAIMNLLLNYDVDPEFPHVLAASAMKNSNRVESLLTHDVDINQSISMGSRIWPGLAALYLAARVNVDTVKLLIKHGANINIQVPGVDSALNVCIERYKVEDIVDIINLVPSWKDILMSDGKTKLVDILFAFKDLDATKNLLQKSRDIIDLFVPSDALLCAGFTLLHLAISFSERIKCESDYKQVENVINFEPDLTVITECLNQGADVTAMSKRNDGHSCTAIYTAFIHGKINVANLLLKYHRGLKNCVDKDNFSHLHIACLLNNRAAIEKLLRNGADVNIVYQGIVPLSDLYSGWTPLYVATSKGDCETVKRLLESGANPHMKDTHSFTPIHILIKHSHPLASELGKILFSLPIHQDHVVENLDLSYLHIACWTKNINAVKKLLDLGVDVNKVFTNKNFNNVVYCVNSTNLDGFNGNTPLHFVLGNPFPSASRKSKSVKLEIVKLLIQRGADIFIKNAAGVSPIVTILISEDQDIDCIDAVIATLRINNPLRRRLEAEFGLTLLHLACRKVDLELVKELLENGFKVNAQVNDTSTIWPGYTPLHILIISFRKFNYFIRKNNYVDKMVRLLLNRGADVTLSNTKQSTSLYFAHHGVYAVTDDSAILVNLLLKAHRNFEINPMSHDGISHFHIACHVLNVVAVKNFLEHDVDVNLAIDTSCDGDISGCSPLLLALKAIDLDDTDSTLSLDELFAQFEIINLLIKHGANVKVEDVSRNTPLHYAAMYESQRENLIQLFVKSGADVNATNMQGETPLELLLKNKKSKIEEIRNFIVFGCHFNSFNVLTEVGYIALATCAFDHDDLQSLLLGLLVNFPNSMKVDNMYRTVIHNVVSIQTTKINGAQYVDLFDICKKFGYDIDDQDYLGRTALHLAAQFRNESAVAGLLLAGADVNITDSSGKTPYAYIFEACSRCISTVKIHNQYSHLKLHKKFVVQIETMKDYDFDVSSSNEVLIDKVIEMLNLFDSTERVVDKLVESDVDDFRAQVAEMMQLQIEPYKLVIGDFILGTAVIDYPMMSRAKREAIDEYFRTNKSQLHTEFQDAAGILRFRYRQAVHRSNIIDAAKDSLSVLMKFCSPEICSHIILKFLKNSELQNMISSTIRNAENL